VCIYIILYYIIYIYIYITFNATGVVEVLVATDVAARGLDVPEVSHVVQVIHSHA
jgi:superfamily II DNA/RNA helicase